MNPPSWYRQAVDNLVILRFDLKIGATGIHAAFSTRHGGTSRPPFAGLNMGSNVGDEPRAVMRNREAFLKALGFNITDIVSSQQVHQDQVHVVLEGDRGRGAFDPKTSIPSRDALITCERRLPLMMYFADCLPVFIFDPSCPAVGIVHSGREGTLRGVVLRTVEKMIAEFGSVPKDCYAAIGPSIRGCCYAVDDRIMDRVMALTDGGLSIHPLTNMPGKYALDLAEVNKYLLVKAGLPQDHIHDVGLCTSCHQDLFFSHQRDVRRIKPRTMVATKGEWVRTPSTRIPTAETVNLQATGRMAGVVWIGGADEIGR